MGIIKRENIVVAIFKETGEIVCLDCLSKDEFEELGEDEFLLSEDLEKTDDIYFCDRCNKRIRE